MGLPWLAAGGTQNATGAFTCLPAYRSYLGFLRHVTVGNHVASRPVNRVIDPIALPECRRLTKPQAHRNPAAGRRAAVLPGSTGGGRSRLGIPPIAAAGPGFHRAG